VVRLIAKCNRKREVGLSLFCDGIITRRRLNAFCFSAQIVVILHKFGNHEAGDRSAAAEPVLPANKFLEKSLTDHRARL